MTMARAAQWLILCLPILGVIIATTQAVTMLRREPVNGHRLPVIALEFVTGKAAFDRIIAAKAEAGRLDRQSVLSDFRANTKFDTWVFVPFYTALYLFVSYSIHRSQIGAMKSLAILLAAIAVAAAVFDLIENSRIFTLLDAALTPQGEAMLNFSAGNELFDGVRRAAAIKFGLIGLFLIVASLPAWAGGGWLRLFAMLLGCAGVLTLVGVFARSYWIEWAFTLVLLCSALLLAMGIRLLAEAGNTV